MTSCRSASASLVRASARSVLRRARSRRGRPAPGSPRSRSRCRGPARAVETALGVACGGTRDLETIASHPKPIPVGERVARDIRSRRHHRGGLADRRPERSLRLGIVLAVAFVPCGHEPGFEPGGCLCRVGLCCGELELHALDLGEVARRPAEPVRDVGEELGRGLRRAMRSSASSSRPSLPPSAESTRADAPRAPPSA